MVFWCLAVCGWQAIFLDLRDGRNGEGCVILPILFVTD